MTDEKKKSLDKLKGIFADKAKEYNNQSHKLSKHRKLPMIIVIVVAIMWAVIIVTQFLLFLGIKLCLPSSWEELTFSFYLITLTLFIFALCLLRFLSKESAKNKKLEEIYRHKGVMIEAYIGYKEKVEEAKARRKDKATTDEEKAMLTALMQNLLAAIRKDPSDSM